MRKFHRFARKKTLIELRDALKAQTASQANAKVTAAAAAEGSTSDVLSELHKTFSPAAEEIAELDRLILAKTSNRELAARVDTLPHGLERQWLELELEHRRHARQPFRQFVLNLAVVLGLSFLGIVLAVFYIKSTQP